MSHDQYENPLISRYASKEMSQIWGAQRKFSTWRKLWIALAEAEQELGLPITDAQIAELKQHIDDIDFDNAAKHEKALRHDVMAHVTAYGDVCPQAKGIIHLGATSCYVTDNADLILLRDALHLTEKRLAAVILKLADFAKEYRSLPCLGFTHLQPAQPTTIGRRACLWNYDLVMDLEELEHRLATLKARSCKGTTGTQASFLTLFDGDHDKVTKLEKRVSEKMGFDATYAVTGQTYSRKIDSQILDALSGIAQSAHKIATDLRILSHRKEVEEPFEKHQIGSSAMPYKRNPMRSERICALARFVMSLQSSGANTLATQWMERTLDDSANRRLTLPQAFLAIDAILIILENVASGMVVYPAMVAKHLNEELPFMASENILMAAVKAGGDRQELHEKIRVHSINAGAIVKNEGKPNDLLQRLQADEDFPEIDMEKVLEPSQYVGRSPEQVDEFLANIVAPIRSRFESQLAQKEELRV
ncbi:adenylosuccinate lyase [Blastopirellula sp. JC732]|uniref:Adenylosuccinate lyase n=1 Tax=Blastopirellula sediminis TaxID=2894196 RepID=A0A9X1SIC0_9BACT|nr:adenylosuccinate lyase [Blastopirellula sediminis]MCC9605623.1 adenylosuccinate lyase [Blastopirellula sediminis]MCC9631077.1 adenylosuccinate lyase [Blastopirellula sediminis]